jgi:hypothetical protein
MEMDNLHFNEMDFDVFLELEPKDKIEFIYDAQFIGKDLSLHKAMSKINSRVNESDERELYLTNLFQNTIQDTAYDEIAYMGQKMTFIAFNNMMHFNSTSLKWINSIVKRLSNDGYVILRNSFAKKTTADQYRYYRCYNIIGECPVTCLN